MSAPSFRACTPAQQLEALGAAFSKPGVQPPKMMLLHKEAYTTRPNGAISKAKCDNFLRNALDVFSITKERIFLDKEVQSLYPPLPLPGESDWLTDHHEAGQTFAEFVGGNRNLPGVEGRDTIYLAPLGDWTPEAQSILKDLKDYVSIYYCMPVTLLKVTTLEDKKVTTRINPYTHNEQYLTKDLMLILSQMLPSKAFCILGITMKDLYPDEEWNYVFGIASLKRRYDPHFWKEKRGKDYLKLLLYRGCKVMTHELGHQFGMKHCIYFSCLMNGSNHLEEFDKRPMQPCPVCLRKLHWSIGFDIVQREENLREFFKQHGFEENVQWHTARLKMLQRSSESTKST